MTLAEPERARDGRHGVRLLGNEQSVDSLDRRDLPGGGCDLPARVAGGHHHLRVDGARHLLEPLGCDIAVVVLRSQDRERLLAVRDGVLKDPVDIALDQEGQQIDARGRDGDVGREGDHRPSRRLCRRRRRSHIVGEHGPEDELRPGAELRLSRLGRAVSGRMVVLNHERDGRGAGIADRQLRRVAHRSADRAWRRRFG